MTPALLVMAKSPVPGQAKTRLSPALTPDISSDIAAAALLDTLNAMRETPARARFVALAGDLSQSRHAVEIAGALAGFVVFRQRGNGFGERLAHAHLHVADACDASVLQIGMDTPQIDAALLVESAQLISSSHAVLGYAADGGWWTLGLPQGAAKVVAADLASVAMSQPTTGADTEAILVRAGLNVAHARPLRDVDTFADLVAVTRLCPQDSRFRRCAEAALHGPAGSDDARD
jgi:uncharacterized protein